MSEACATCPRMADQFHHVVYQQHVRGESLRFPDRTMMSLLKDHGNLLPLCFGCHESHHDGGKWRIALVLLRDENYDFARWLLGAERAYEYLRRRYGGDDERLDALLASEYARSA